MLDLQKVKSNQVNWFSKMTKFNVLQVNKEYMLRLGIYSNNLTEPTNEFLKSLGTFLIVGAAMHSIISSTVHIFLGSSDFMSILDSVLIIFAIGQSLCVYINIGIKMKQIKVLHLKLQSIVNGSKKEFLGPFFCS